MLKTKIDPLWGQACEAIQLQAKPGPKMLDAIQKLQDRISVRAGISLRQIPPQCLHMTVLTILHPVTDFGRSKFEIWEEHSAVWQNALVGAISQMGSFSLSFDRISVSDMAIFLQAAVPPELLSLRQQITQAISIGEWRPKPPDIAHITLFRYAEEGALPESEQSLLSAALPMRVESLQLIRETVFPTLEADPIAQFSFRNAF